MTIPSNYLQEHYTLGGVGPYLFGFDVVLETDVRVRIDGIDIDPSLYSVTLNGPGPVFDGGSLTFTETVSGTTLTISRVTTPTQEVVYEQYGTFPLEEHEFGLDKLTLITQDNANRLAILTAQQDEDATHTLTSPVSIISEVPLDYPCPATIRYREHLGAGPWVTFTVPYQDGKQGGIYSTEMFDENQTQRIWSQLATNGRGIMVAPNDPLLSDDLAYITVGMAKNLSGVANKIFLNLSPELRSISGSGNTRADTLGYNTIGDYGGGEFNWDGASLADDDGGLTFKPDSIAVDAPGRWRLLIDGESVSGPQFGATGDGDVTAALQAALDSGLNVTLPGLNFNTSATLLMSTEGQMLSGVKGNGDFGGSTATRITASHTSGAVIEYSARSTKIQSLSILSTQARYDAVTTTGHGIYQNPPDAPKSGASRPWHKDLFIFMQPTDGMHLHSGVEHGLLELIVAQDCKRHGFLIDDGTASGRTNRDLNLFELDVNRCRAFECGGHAAVFGGFGTTGTPRLLRTIAFEALGCGWNPSVMYSEHQVYSSAWQTVHTHLDIEDQQWDQTTTAQGNPRNAKAAASPAIVVTRNSHRLVQPYISSSGPDSVSGACAITVAANLESVIIQNPQIVAGTYGVQQDPSIVIPASTVGAQLELWSANTSGSDKILSNQSLSTNYTLDGVAYAGAASTAWDAQLNDVWMAADMTATELITPYTKVMVNNPLNAAVNLTRFRNFNNATNNLRDGVEVTLMWNGSVEYDIIILDKAGQSARNIITKGGASITLNSATPVAKFVCRHFDPGGANEDWQLVEI